MAEQTPQFDAEDVELIDHSSVYKGFFEVRSLTLKHRLYEGGWSQAIKRELFVRHDAVGVLLYDPALDAVALIEQFRVGAYGHQGSGPKSASPWLLELVAGLIDKDESPELVAQREAQEEAGALISDMLPIYQYFSSPGGSCEFFHLYCGRSDLSAVGGIHGLADEAEDIRVQVIPVAQAWQKLQRGDINNAHSIIALQWLMMNKTQVQERWR